MRAMLTLALLLSAALLLSLAGPVGAAPDSAAPDSAAPDSATPDSAAEDWSLEAFLKQKSAWEGHGVGSSVTETTTMKMPSMPNMPNMPNIPGMPKDGKLVTTEKTTLTKITKDAFVLTIESSGMMGRKTTRTKTEPRLKVLKPTMTDGGPGAVTVEGKAYPCAIKNVTSMDAIFGDALEKGAGKGKRGRTSQGKMGPGKIFVHPKLGVLKIETSMDMMGQKATVIWQVTRLSAAHTLGAKSYPCREITVTTKMSMGTTKMTMLSTRLVPGGSLKQVVNTEMMGRKIKNTTEITAYVKKPLTATTAPAAK